MGARRAVLGGATEIGRTYVLAVRLQDMWKSKSCFKLGKRSLALESCVSQFPDILAFMEIPITLLVVSVK